MAKRSADFGSLILAQWTPLVDSEIKCDAAECTIFNSVAVILGSFCSVWVELARTGVDIVSWTLIPRDIIVTFFNNQYAKRYMTEKLLPEKRCAIMKVFLFEIILAAYQSSSSCILDLGFLFNAPWKSNKYSTRKSYFVERSKAKWAVVLY